MPRSCSRPKQRAGTTHAYRRSSSSWAKAVAGAAPDGPETCPEPQMPTAIVCPSVP